MKGGFTLMMMLQVFGWVLLLFTFGQVDLITTDYSDDVMAPIVELDDNSLYTVFTTVSPYDWEDVNSTFSLSLTEQQLDDFYSTYMTIKDYAPYQRSSSTIGEASMTDCVIVVAFMLLWFFALPYAVKRIKKSA